jgi:hypothetical protein
VSRFAERGISRIELDGGDWVDIKTALRFGDRLAIEEKLYSAGIGENGTPKSLNLEAASVEALLRGIVAWGGPGFCEHEGHPHEGECRSRPINAANIQELDATGEFLIQEIKARQVTSTPNLKGTPAKSTSSISSDPASSTSIAGSTSSNSASDSDGAGTIS